MKLTQERLVELKTMAEHARSHFCIELAEAFVRSVPALIAGLEEAREQLASPYMDGYEAAKEEHRTQIIALEAELAATRKQLAEAQSSDSVTVRYDLSPLKTEEAIKAKVRELGWLDPDAARKLFVRAGIYTEEGKLREAFGGNNEEGEANEQTI